MSVATTRATNRVINGRGKTLGKGNIAPLTHETPMVEIIYHSKN